jgi:hypothetical protein
MRHLWFYDGVFPVISAWLDHELEVLRAFRGRYQAVEPHIREAMKLCNEFALLYTDQCSASKQDEAYGAIESCLLRVLDLMIQEEAPSEDILRLSKEVESLGDVSPTLRVRAWEAVRERARKKSDEAYEALRQAVEADLRSETTLARLKTLLAWLKEA